MGREHRHLHVQRRRGPRQDRGEETRPPPQETDTDPSADSSLLDTTAAASYPFVKSSPDIDIAAKWTLPSWHRATSRCWSTASTQVPFYEIQINGKVVWSFYTKTQDRQYQPPIEPAIYHLGEGMIGCCSPRCCSPLQALDVTSNSKCLSATAASSGSTWRARPAAARDGDRYLVRVPDSGRLAVPQVEPSPPGTPPPPPTRRPAARHRRSRRQPPETIRLWKPRRHHHPRRVDPIP